MDKKSIIRKKYLIKRKEKYFSIDFNFFKPLTKIIKKKFKTKIINISFYYPNYYELDVLKILDLNFYKKMRFLLPVIEDNNLKFYEWKKRNILYLNKYGIPEPEKVKSFLPKILLVPLVAFDKNKNRLGYGKGFYDKYLYKSLKNNKDILAIGIAFSFQRYKNLPTDSKDFKLNYIITEKGII